MLCVCARRQEGREGGMGARPVGRWVSRTTGTKVGMSCVKVHVVRKL